MGNAERSIMQGELTILDKNQIEKFIEGHPDWKEYASLLRENIHYFIALPQEIQILLMGFASGISSALINNLPTS